MKLLSLSYCLCISFLLAACQMSPSVSTKEANIKAGIEAKYPGSNVLKVKYIEALKIYEVLTDKNIIIVDDKINYAFIGDIYEIDTNKKINTLNHLNSYQKLDADMLNGLSGFNQITEKKGNYSKNKVTIFTDIYCSYCKQLEQVLAKLDNIQIDRIVYPNINVDQTAHNNIANILCDQQPLTIYQKYISGTVEGTAVKTASSECLKKVQDNKQLAQTYRLQGTPTLINQKGEVLAGLTNMQELQDFISNKH